MTEIQKARKVVNDRADYLIEETDDTYVLADAEAAKKVKGLDEAIKHILAAEHSFARLLEQEQ